MKVLVCGAGNIGVPTCYYLRQLGHEVWLTDVSSDAINKAQEKFSQLNVGINTDDTFTTSDWKTNYKLYDAVLSCLPYHQNRDLAFKCIGLKVPYFDLGGHVETSYEINSYANKYNSFAFTDLGLAPGFISFVAHKGLEAIKPDNVYLAVGGLPQQITNRFGYSCTWSPDGLMNEYFDDCQILENGEIKTVKGMSGYTEMTFVPSNMKLEAFRTSGGASHLLKEMKEAGVKNCEYKTLRYVGHAMLIQALNDLVGTEKLKEIIIKECPKQDDVVRVHASMQNSIETWSYTRDIVCNEHFSAMQIATAIPFVAAVDTFHEEQQGFLAIEPRSLTYQDINIPIFFYNCARLGL